jgi:anti-sigma factor RsiW
MHLAIEQLQLLADGAVGRGEAAALHAHLERCAQCASAYQRVRGFDRAMRRIPLVAAPPGFTDGVLGRLHIVPRSSRVLGILGFVAPAFSVLLVGALSFLLVGLTGPPAQGSVQELSGHGVWTDMLHALTAGVDAATAWLMQALSQPVGRETWSIVLTLAGVMPALLLLDWLIRKRNAMR